MAWKEMLNDAGGRTLSFRSADLPPELSETQRRGVIFDDVFAAMGGASDFVLSEEGAVDVRFDCAAFSEVALIRPAANVSRWRRTARHVAADRQDRFHIGLNIAGAGFGMAQAQREAVHAPGQTVLFRTDAPLDVRAPGGMATLCLSIPADRLRRRVAGVEDMMLRPIDDASPALRHLWRYAGWLLDADEPAEDPLLWGRVEEMLVDLAVLALDAGGEAAEIAGQRGLRLVRLREVLAAIRRDYAMPDFGPAVVAADLGLSPRYVQDLLQETGRSFTERVLELRLQCARAMLADPARAGTRIIDIALASGFNDISYFNRTFRRRFGMRPNELRGRREV